MKHLKSSPMLSAKLESEPQYVSLERDAKEAASRNSGQVDTSPIRGCRACGGGLYERDNFCRHCGALQEQRTVAKPQASASAASSHLIPVSRPTGRVGPTRYNLDGSLDNSSGGNGIVLTDSPGGMDEAYALILMPDG